MKDDAKWLRELANRLAPHAGQHPIYEMDPYRLRETAVRLESPRQAILWKRVPGPWPWSRARWLGQADEDCFLIQRRNSEWELYHYRQDYAYETILGSDEWRRVWNDMTETQTLERTKWRAEKYRGTL